MSLIINDIISEGTLSSNTLSVSSATITNLVVTNITGASTTDYYVTGGTYSSGTLTLERNGLSDVTITGFSDGTLTGSGVTNKVAFWSGASGLTFDNTFHWDNTNKRLGVGTSSPSQKLQISGNTRVDGSVFANNLIVTAVTGTNIFSGNTSSDLVRITQTGSGNAFVVEDSVNTDSSPFVINSLGNVAIGTTTFDGTNPEKLVVAPANQNAIVAKGPISGFMQLNIQNTSNSVTASSDVVATNDTGNDTNNYINMGINSSTYTAGNIGVANDAYLYNIGRELYIGNATVGANGNIKFFAGNLATATTMTITSAKRVGIGINSPTQKLHVSGNSITTGTISGSSLNVTTLPTLNNANSDFLTRNSATGQIERSTPGNAVFYAYGIAFAQSIGNYLT